MKTETDYKSVAVADLQKKNGMASNATGSVIEMMHDIHTRTNRPVVVLHHELPSNVHFQRKIELMGNSTDGKAKPLTEFQISQYQICMWTGIVFLLLVLVSICSVAQMDIKPDSLLQAKFVTARTSNKMD